MPSRKMNGEVAVPGHIVALPLMILFERDREVLEYYFQPFSRELPIFDADGKVRTYIEHTPSALVIRRDGIVVHT